ncbi:hypothetical protein CAI16_03610 [Virgibacillus dokdonensis]|uniref:DUF1146 family protein n=2 Tax=Virgibacillus TaxID=84406 RepID=A0A2K9J4Y1_9BACI|nr:MULTISPECIES: DUF1146 family protein [Virgibacillus]AUJ24040.1 hypothetical protein A21D_00928 [Virgibacillus dokdonensis]NWO15061.1 DUF1146 domain-containing protein [Virgibacillus sp.]RFA36706.1 hypothetical protein CAI16_03610 [Virgibacillus dokdonensis]SHH59884.1 conserved hypothetical integral membrane protein [Virgibacillus chiguensis]
MFSLGQQALVSLISHILFIYVTWRLMMAINFEPMIKKGRAKEAQILILFLTIVIGSGVSRFFLEVLQWSRDLNHLF